MNRKLSKIRDEKEKRKRRLKDLVKKINEQQSSED